MLEREGFEAAIRDNPTDYNLRLVFADWLDQHDEPEEADRQRKYRAAKEWVRDFADKIDQGYSFLLRCAREWLEYRRDDGDNWDNYVHMGTNEGYKDATDEDWAKFWVNYEIVTGEKVPMEKRDGPTFSCSC